MKMRRFFIAVMAAAFAFTSCDNFLTDNLGFKSLLEEEVHDSTAIVLNVKVQAIPGQGNAYASTDTVKLDVSFQVSFEVDSNYGVFNYWKAYANYEKENQRELTEEDIWFSKVNALTTEVKILKEYSDIRIVPYCTRHPQINIVMPSGLVNPGTLTPSGAQTIEVGKEYTITMQTSTGYGFKGWKIYAMEGDKEVELKIGEDYTATEYEPEVSESTKNFGATKAKIAICVVKAMSKSIYIEPILYAYPVLNIINYHDPEDVYDANAVLTPPHGTTRGIIIGEECTVKIKTSTAYGFSGWKVYEMTADGEKKNLVKGTDYTTPYDESETAEANSSGTITVSTTFSFLREFENPVYIMPDVYEYPRLFVSLGAKYAEMTSADLAEIGSISPVTGENGRAIVSGSENKITLKTTAAYGFTGWKISAESGVDAPALEAKYYNIISNDSIYSDNGTTATMVIVFDGSLKGNVYIEPVLSGYPEAYIQLSNSAAGSITPTGLQKIMIDRDYTVSLQTHSEYGFSGWKFYNSSDRNGSRKEFPVCKDGDTGPDGTYVYMTSNANPDTTQEIVKNASFIVYNTIKDTSSSGGSVKASAYIRMTKNIDFICIEGNVSTNPVITFATPKFNGDEAGSITPLGSARQSSDNEFSVSVRLNDLYSFDGWQLSNGNGFLTLTDYFEKKSENINSNKSEATAVLKIKDGANVDGFTISAKTKIRPQVRDTSPASGATGVVRTPDVTIVFTKAIAAKVKTKPSDYFTIGSRSSMTDSNSTDVTEKFTFVTSGSDTVATFKFADKKTESNWLSSKGYITVTVKNALEDTDGVMLGKDYAFSFTTGTSGDSEGPIISDATLKTTATTLTASSSEQAYWGDWEPSSGADENHVYADSFRTKCSTDDSDKFTATITASDDETGNTGISGYYVIQRLMYVPKGGRLPNTSRLADSDMTLFAADGTWNGLSGCMPSDYEKEIELTASTGNTFTPFALSADFKDTSSNPVDGIYMLELTAKDGLGNKSGNPARYFIVRDTTPPSTAENAEKFYISDGGVVVDGKRYFNSNSQKVTVKAPVTDFGTQGQPRTASKTLQWSFVFLLSDESIDNTGTWCSYSAVQTFLNHPFKSLTIPETYLSGSDKKVYVWFKLKDDLGNECAPTLATGAVIYIDLESPNFPEITSGNARFDGDTIYLSSSSENVKFEATDPSTANCSSGCKVVVMQNAKALTPNSDGTYTLASGRSYTIYSQDGVGNKSEEKTFTTALSPTLNITDISLDDGRENITKNFWGNRNSSIVFATQNDFTVGNFNGTSTTYNLDTSGYTNGNVRLKFTINEGTSSVKSIKITGMDVSRYTIGSNSAVNLYSPVNEIPVPASCNNVQFVLEGKLSGCKFDGTSDGAKTVKISVADEITTVEESKQITLKAAKPEFTVTHNNVGDSVYSEETGIYTVKAKNTDVSGITSPAFRFNFNYDSSFFYYNITVESEYGEAYMMLNKDKVKSFDLRPTSVNLTYDTYAFFDRDCVVTITCYDKYGNSSSKRYNFFADFEAPTVTPIGISKANNYYWLKAEGEKAKFEVEDNPGGSRVKSYSFVGSDWSEVVSGNEAAVIELSPLNYTCSVLDNADNYSVFVINIKVDNTAPGCNTNKQAVGIVRNAAGAEKECSNHNFKDLIYAEIEVTETESGLKENGIYFPGLTIEKYSLDDGITWNYPNDSTDAIPVVAGTKYKTAQKICLYLYAPPISDRYFPIACIEDVAGNSTGVLLSKDPNSSAFYPMYYKEDLQY